jgi:hypothetical protein
MDSVGFVAQISQRDQVADRRGDRLATGSVDACEIADPDTGHVDEGEDLAVGHLQAVVTMFCGCLHQRLLSALAAGLLRDAELARKRSDRLRPRPDREEEGAEARAQRVEALFVAPSGRHAPLEIPRDRRQMANGIVSLGQALGWIDARSR